jgi:hypothetical protein
VSVENNAQLERRLWISRPISIFTITERNQSQILIPADNRADQRIYHWMPELQVWGSVGFLLISYSTQVQRINSLRTAAIVLKSDMQGWNSRLIAVTDQGRIQDFRMGGVLEI